LVLASVNKIFAEPFDGDFFSKLSLQDFGSSKKPTNDLDH